MKRIAAIAVIGGLLVATSAWASQVTNVEISYQDGFTVARIDVQGPVRFTHLTEVPKDGRPDRVIVDLLAATHELGAKEFLELPPCIITGIRSSQYAVSPENITRIVFDLRSAPVYRVEAGDNSVTVYLSEKEPRNFAIWSTNAMTPRKDEPRPVVLAAQPVAVPAVKAKNVQARNEAIERDRKTSLSANTKPAEPVVPTTAAWEKSPAKDRSFNARLFSEALDYAPKIKDIPQPLPMDEENGEVAVDVSGNVKSAKPVEMVNVPKPIKNNEVVQQVKEPAPQPVLAKKEDINKVESKPASKPPEKKPSVAPSTTWFPPMSFSDGAQFASSENFPETDAGTMPSAGSLDPDVSSADFEPAVESDNVELAKEPSEPAPGAARATARFRREVQSDKIRGTMVAEFPERLVIKYERTGQRDPFSSLINDGRTYDAPVENRIPNVEGLKLVGIIDSEGGQNQALFEDKTGFSYILKTGDKVRNGYVLRVEPEQVYFQIFEYGWSRTVALTME